MAGAQVIVIDNGSRPECATEIRAMVERLGGVYLRNEANAGFAAANNQGLAQATGDIVLFLNDDIAAESGFLDCVARDVSDGLLAGPALQRQLVYGIWLSYLEGWCLAARRDVWTRLGGWDTVKYPQVDELRELADRTEFVFHQADVLAVEIEHTDLLFIDTLHFYQQLRDELRLHAAKARKYIVLHDTTTFADRGEQQGSQGIWSAVEEFLAQTTFQLKHRYSNNNGLTDRAVEPSEELAALTTELKQVNESLWQIEDEIRSCERNKDFGPRFIELARSVYHQNDRRSAIKRQINDLLGSEIVEEKSYASYV